MTPVLGVRLVSALPHGRLAPTVQTITRYSAQRKRVVSIAARGGMRVLNAALTAGTRASGIGRVASSVPTRWQYAAGGSACAGDGHVATCAAGISSKLVMTANISLHRDTTGRGTSAGV